MKLRHIKAVFTGILIVMMVQRHLVVSFTVFLILLLINFAEYADRRY